MQRSLLRLLLPLLLLLHATVRIKCNIVSNPDAFQQEVEEQQRRSAERIPGESILGQENGLELSSKLIRKREMYEELNRYDGIHYLPPPGPTNWLVMLIDQYESPDGIKNYLFRGDLPLASHHKFNYDLLARILESKVRLPEYYYVVDIALIWEFWPDEVSWVKTEKNFFGNFTALGEFIHWPLYGDVENPNDYRHNQQELEFYARTLAEWQEDQLPAKMATMRKLLTTNYTIPHVFYVHCSSGVDRTGEFMIAYQITYLKKVFHQAMSEADDLSYIVNGRPLFPMQAFSALWYCWYMYYVETLTYLDCHLPDIQR